MVSFTSNRFGEDAAAISADLLPHDVAMQTLLMVNVAYVGEPGSADWVLVDAGIPGMASRIEAFARDRYGEAPPKAIVLTHGHFDHVGSLRTLADKWDVPIYAHELELPYLTGKSSYPPPDPTVGGGLMARLAPLYPVGPTDFSGRVQALPADGSVPGMSGWRWIATPGHSPGHVSFFRDADGTLIVGDAFVTQKQESLIGVLTAAVDFRGPPTYFTPDWEASRASVRRLADLLPQRALTGHGLPLANPRLAQELQDLASNFDERAIPRKGRYVNSPAVTDETGVVSVPPKPSDLFPAIAIVAGLTVVGVAAFLLANRKQCADGSLVGETREQLDACDD